MFSLESRPKSFDRFESADEFRTTGNWQQASQSLWRVMLTGLLLERPTQHRDHLFSRHLLPG